MTRYIFSVMFNAAGNKCSAYSSTYQAETLRGNSKCCVQYIILVVLWYTSDKNDGRIPCHPATELLIRRQLTYTHLGLTAVCDSSQWLIHQCLPSI